MSDSIESLKKDDRDAFVAQLRSMSPEDLNRYETTLIDKKREIEERAFNAIRSDDIDMANAELFQLMIAKRQVVDRIALVKSEIVERLGGPAKSKELQETKRLLVVNTGIVQRLRRKNRFKNCPQPDMLRKMADDNRMKNGKINFSRLGKALSVTNHTAKKWCEINGIR